LFPYVFWISYKARIPYWKGKLKPANIIFPYELWILYKVDNFNSIEVSNFGSIGILIFFKETNSRVLFYKESLILKDTKLATLFSFQIQQQMQLFYKGSIIMFFANEYVAAIQLS